MWYSPSLSPGLREAVLCNHAPLDTVTLSRRWHEAKLSQCYLLLDNLNKELQKFCCCCCCCCRQLLSQKCGSTKYKFGSAHVLISKIRRKATEGHGVGKRGRKRDSDADQDRERDGGGEGEGKGKNERREGGREEEREASDTILANSCYTASGFCGTPFSTSSLGLIWMYFCWCVIKGLSN